MVVIDKTTPVWTFKKQLENSFGPMSKSKFHEIWNNHFSKEYTRICLHELNQESHCSLCGHEIYSQEGKIVRTGNKIVQYNGIDVSIPDEMTVGCDCYGNNIKPLLNIVSKLEEKFNLIEIPIDKDKINILRLISELARYELRNTCVPSYKIMIPVKYLYCSNYDTMANWMGRTMWTRYYPTTKAKKNITDVIFGIYDKPLANVRPGTWGNCSNTWKVIFNNSEFIVVINSDMIKNITEQYKQKG